MTKVFKPVEVGHVYKSSKGHSFVICEIIEKKYSNKGSWYQVYGKLLDKRRCRKTYLGSCLNEKMILRATRLKFDRRASEAEIMWFVIIPSQRDFIDRDREQA